MAKTKTRKPDLRFEGHGSVTLIRPLTKAGAQWIEENVQHEGWQWFGGALAADPRLAVDVALGAKNDGLEVD